MMEVRTIRREEADTFLELLCGVFELDASRARHVFYGEPFFDLARKWALFDGGEMISILTTVPLEFGWGKGFGIAGVATRRDRQGEGVAAKLLSIVLRESEVRGEAIALLFAKDDRLYRRVGFTTLDKVIRGTIQSDHAEALPPDEPVERVVRRYEEWCSQDPARLRRDERRWRYWNWNLKICSQFLGGYVCVEGSFVRECIADGRAEAWPVPPNSQWLGLEGVAELLGVPLVNRVDDLMLMGRGAPGAPQMFMTDQF